MFTTRITGSCALLAAVCLLGAGCADRQRRNPLDAKAESPLSFLQGLEVAAEDGMVRLKWNLTTLSDLDGIRVHRVGGPEGERVFEVPGSTQALTDSTVTNGFVYRYSLSMIVQDEGEVSVGDPQLATPGPEIGWLADRGSGLVWRLTPDGRAGLFAQGRFPSIAAIAIDAQEGACWVSDRRFRSLHRIDREGDLRRIGTALEAGGDLAVDTQTRTGWVADRLRFDVYSFDLDVVGDTLQLTEIDGTFHDEVELAVQSGSLWIADPAGERVLLYDPDGRRVSEWTQLKGLTQIDASAQGTVAWVLATDGLDLLRLEPDQPPQKIFMPFIDPAVALDVGDVDGDVWVAGDSDVAAYTGTGVPILHWDNVPGTRDVAIDERNRHVWIAAATQLWKVSLGVSYQTQLTGFTETVQVVVDAGGS